MVKKIALEEHFLCPGFEDYWNADRRRLSTRKSSAGCWRSLTDFGEMRLGSHGPRRHRARGPWRWRAQACRSSVTPQRRAARRAKPTIFWRARSRSGRTAIPASRICRCRTPRPPPSELERCMRELKFCGAMINGHTNGQYLDHPIALSILGTRGGAGRADLSASRRSGRACPGARWLQGLRRATWEWTFETGSHALRLIFGGVFDRFPRAKLGARPSRRDVAVPALALRQPRRPGLLRRSSSQSARRNTSRTISSSRPPACVRPSRSTCAIAALGHEQRDVRRRLSVQVRRRKPGISSTASRSTTRCAERHLLQQCRPAAAIADLNSRTIVPTRKEIIMSTASERITTAISDQRARAPLAGGPPTRCASATSTRWSCRTPTTGSAAT